MPLTAKQRARREAVQDGYLTGTPARVLAAQLGMTRAAVSQIACTLRKLGELPGHAPRFKVSGVTRDGLTVTVASDSQTFADAHLAALCV